MATRPRSWNSGTDTPIHSRSRSPERSVKGLPLSCTRAPGACPATSKRAPGRNQTTGRGACPVAVAANRSAQRRQAAMSSISRIRPDWTAAACHASPGRSPLRRLLGARPRLPVATAESRGQKSGTARPCSSTPESRRMDRVSSVVPRCAKALLGGAGLATLRVNPSPASHCDRIEGRLLVLALPRPGSRPAGRYRHLAAAGLAAAATGHQPARCAVRRRDPGHGLHRSRPRPGNRTSRRCDAGSRPSWPGARPACRASRTLSWPRPLPCTTA